MSRKTVLFLVIALVAIGALTAPSTPKSQGAVATVLNQVAPTAQCQGDRCQVTRNTCYWDWRAVFSFCMVLTDDLSRCNKEFNEGYRACAGECWRPDLGVFVIPAAQVVALNDDNRDKYL